MLMLHTVYQTLSRYKLFIFDPFNELVGIPEGWRRSHAIIFFPVGNVFRWVPRRYSSLAILYIRGFCLVEGREHFTRHRERIVVTAEGGQLRTREETATPMDYFSVKPYDTCARILVEIRKCKKYQNIRQ